MQLRGKDVGTQIYATLKSARSNKSNIQPIKVTDTVSAENMIEKRWKLIAYIYDFGPICSLYSNSVSTAEATYQAG
jgi:hypothetical protein